MSADLMCPSCGNPSRDGGLCDADERTLAAVLAGAPDLLDELLTQTARLGVASIGGRRPSEKPLPINLRASELAAGYENLLVSWARACGGDDDPALTGAGREAARWLAERIYEIRIHEAAGEIVDELSGHARSCLRAIDRHGSDDVYLGDCEAVLPPNDITCKTPLRVKQGARKGSCWRCEATFDVGEMLEIRDARIDGSLATVREIASAGFRTPDGRAIGQRMIEGYVRRGTVVSKGSRSGVALYCIGDVKEAALRARYPKAGAKRHEMPISA